MIYLVTGVAGFIGSQLAKDLLASGERVVGIDNLNDYYAPELKRARLAELQRYGETFEFVKMDLAQHDALLSLPCRDEVGCVVHLAAQAGVRYSLENPFAYAQSNLTGHLAILEFCRAAAQRPFLAYASSSSVYGEGLTPPFAETAHVDSPESLYAATKRADELMSKTYAKLYDIKQIGMRFFTVYGPWGRPDMAYWSFTDQILRGEPIRVFNGGKMKRDFTYIADAVAAVKAIVTQPADFSGCERPHKIYNIGHSKPIALLDFIQAIERATGRSSHKTFEPMQPGDVTETCADITAITADYDYRPQTDLQTGINAFVAWYKHYLAEQSASVY